MSDEVDRYCMTKGFTFQPSFFKQISRKARVSDRERAYRYICEYMFLGKVPEFPETDILADFWDGAYPTLHKTKALVLSKMKDDTTPSTSGSTSTSTTPSTSEKQPEVHQEHNAKYFYQGNGNGIGNGYGKGEGEAINKYNAAPTLEEAEEFAGTEGIRTNVRKFHSYYSARNWMTNGEPVHDWKALLRVWASRDKDGEKPEPEQPKEPPAETTCPGCGSQEIRQQFNYLVCSNPMCGKSYTWNGKKWRQDC